MLELQPQRPSDESCPKRQWVMLALADDDSDAGGRSSLLNAHLAYCVSCREMADRVLGVESRLDDLAVGAPSQLQVQSILDRGLAAARDAQRVEVIADEESEVELEAGWRARLVHRLLHPRPGRFGRTQRQVQLRHTLAASLFLALIGGGYFGYRQFNLSAPPTSIPALANDEQPWVQVPTLSEMGVSERLTEWQMKARSPFVKIQGWKGPVRRLDNANLNINWGLENAVATPEQNPAERDLGTDKEDAKVATRRNAPPPTNDLWPKPTPPVDSTSPAVLSKGFKDTR